MISVSLTCCSVPPYPRLIDMLSFSLTSQPKFILIYLKIAAPGEMNNCSTTTNTDPILDDFSDSCRLKWVQQSRCLTGYLQVNRYQPVTWLVPGRKRSSIAAPWGRESAFVTKPSHLGYLHFNAGARLGGAVFVRKQAGVTAKGGCPTPPMSSHPARVPFPPFNCTVTGKNQPLIRQCYLIKTAPRLALALITSNLEKDGGRGKTE